MSLAVVFLQFRSLAPSPGALIYPKISFFEYDHQIFALLWMVHTVSSGKQLKTTMYYNHFWTEPRYCGQSQVEVINSRYLLPWPQINCTKNLTLKSSHCSIRMWHRTFSEWWVVHFAIFRDSAPRQIHMYLHFFSWRITHVTGHKVKNKPSFRFPFFIIYFLL